MRRQELCKLWWDINTQCDKVIKSRRPDIIISEKKENRYMIMDKRERTRKMLIAIKT